MTLDILKQLEATSSKNAKVAILKGERDNDVLWNVIKLALDPFTQFYIRKIPKYSMNEDLLCLEDALESLSLLSSRRVTGNAGIAHLQYILAHVSPDDAEVIERVISKDLKCGVNIGTVNKVIPNFIFEYPVMLCSKLEQRLLDKITYPAMVQQKLDGMRFNAIVKGDKVEFRSRSGKLLDFNGCLEQDFIDLANTSFIKNVDPAGVVFDGELLIADGDSYVDRKTGNGILSRANKGMLSLQDSDLVRTVLWDVISYSDFMKHKSDRKYSARFDSLQSGIINYAKDKRNIKIKLAQTHFVDDLQSANDIFKDYLAKGHEGIILKNIFCGWEFNRVPHQIKFKGELECDLEVIDWVESSTGKYVGKLGAVVCSTSDGLLKVSVGSGFSDEQRATIDRSIIGKIITVKYNERITNKVGENSLFLPIFIEVREDKTVANNFEELE